MTFNNFVNLFLGKATDFDKGEGIQCVDLAKMFIYYVLGITPKAIGNAEAYWRKYNSEPYLNKNFDKIPNTPTFIPQKGDIVVWGNRGKNGHIAIANGQGTIKYFYSYDQNWGGSKKMKLVKHNYKGGFTGVLRPKDQSKTNGQVMKYQVGWRVLVNIPIKFTGATEGDKWLVESNGYQFWIHKSVIKNDRVYGMATIMEVHNGYYKVRIFEGKNECRFDCKEVYMG